MQCTLLKEGLSNSFQHWWDKAFSSSPVLSSFRLLRASRQSYLQCTMSFFESCKTTCSWGLSIGALFCNYLRICRESTSVTPSHLLSLCGSHTLQNTPCSGSRTLSQCTRDCWSYMWNVSCIEIKGHSLVLKILFIPNRKFESTLRSMGFVSTWHLMRSGHVFIYVCASDCMSVYRYLNYLFKDVTQSTPCICETSIMP